MLGGPMPDGTCGTCGAKLPHRKVSCTACGMSYDDCEDWSGPAHPLRDCVAHLQQLLDAALVREVSASEERDSARALLKESHDRLSQYTGGCACPGVSCVESCSECHRTQGLVNRIYAVIRPRTVTEGEK